MTIIRDMPLSEYHTRDAVSSSRLSDFARSPRLYFDKWVGKTIADFEEQETTDSKRFGQAFEDLLLLPHTAFLAKWAIKPEGHDGRTKGGREWTAANAGKPALSQSEHRKAEHMVSAIHEHADAIAMIRECEQQVTMDCRVHGSLLQSRPDFVNFAGSALSDFRPYTADLKTTEKLERVLSGRAIVEYGYHRQAEIAAICMQENSVGPEWAADSLKYEMKGNFAHYLIIVEKVLPHRVAVREFTPGFLASARTWIFKNLAGIEQCAHASYWPRSEQGIQLIDAPAWYVGDVEEEAA